MNNPVRFTRENSVLIIIDIQERLARTMKKLDLVVRNNVKLIKTAETLDIPILVTEQYPEGLGNTIAELSIANGKNVPIVKKTFSCCGVGEFKDAVRGTGRENIILTGMETHICLLQTALDLIADGYSVGLVLDAVTSYNKGDIDTAVNRLSSEGVIILSTEMIIYELLKEAGTPEFKKLLPAMKEREQYES